MMQILGASGDDAWLFSYIFADCSAALGTALLNALGTAPGNDALGRELSCSTAAFAGNSYPGNAELFYLTLLVVMLVLGIISFAAGAATRDAVEKAHGNYAGTTFFCLAWLCWLFN